MLPLEGIRIVDFGRVLSVPYGTMQLADLGARCSKKIEHPEYGDDTRSFDRHLYEMSVHILLGINRGKRSVALDLKKADDVDFVKELISVADVVVEGVLFPLA